MFHHREDASGPGDLANDISDDFGDDIGDGIGYDIGYDIGDDIDKIYEVLDVLILRRCLCLGVL